MPVKAGVAVGGIQTFTNNLAYLLQAILQQTVGQEKAAGVVGSLYLPVVVLEKSVSFQDFKITDNKAPRVLRHEVPHDLEPVRHRSLKTLNYSRHHCVARCRSRVKRRWWILWGVPIRSPVR